MGDSRLAKICEIFGTSREPSSSGIEQVSDREDQVYSIKALTDFDFDSQERRSLTLVPIRAAGRTSTCFDTMYLVENGMLYLVRNARSSLSIRRVLLEQRSST